MFAPTPGSRAGQGILSAAKRLGKMLDLAFNPAQGDILYRDSAAWKLLAPGTSGDVLTTQGAGANPHWAAGSGSATGLFNGTLSAIPTQSGTGFTSWLHQPASATVANGNNGVVVYCPSQSGTYNQALIDQAVPSTPYSFKALVANVNAGMIANESANYPFGIALLGWSDGTKITAFGLYYDPNTGDPTGLRLGVFHMSALTGASSSVVWGTIQCPANPVWLKLFDDGTDLYFGLSFDGDSYLTLYSEARTSYLSAVSDVVFGCSALDANTYSTLMSWTQGTS
jgi:hypothetical protein